MGTMIDATISISNNHQHQQHSNKNSQNDNHHRNHHNRNKNMTYTMSEVRKHNTIESAWILVGRDIYDITSYIEHHPGGPTSLLKRAGGVTDCYQDFQFHSKNGKRQWDQFKIGRLQSQPQDSSSCWWTSIFQLPQ